MYGFINPSCCAWLTACFLHCRWHITSAWGMLPHGLCLCGTVHCHSKDGYQNESTANWAAKLAAKRKAGFASTDAVRYAERTLMLASQMKVNMNTFMPTKRLLPGDTRPDPASPLVFDCPTLIFKEDREKSGKSGLYLCLYHPKSA